MDVIAYDPYLPPWIAREYRVRLVGSLEELARDSDFVSVHTPLNRQTEKLLGESFFKAMKQTAYFVNTCRGPVVDEAALIKALDGGEIAGAGLDVFEEEPTSPDNPLLKMDNVIATPHSAGSSNMSPHQVGPTGRPGDLASAARDATDVGGQPGGSALDRGAAGCSKYVDSPMREGLYLPEAPHSNSFL